MEVQKCLAKGTMITLSDGSKKPIESAFAGDKLRSQASDRTVTATTIGNELNPMYQINTENGKGLLITRNHPVVSTQGMQLANSLKVGESIITDEGPSKISSISQNAYNETVHNLTLENNGSDADPTSYFANGILVGDSNSQQRLIKQQGNNHTNQQQLPKQWHKDFNDIID